MNLVKAILQYDDQTIELTANKMLFFDELYVDFKKNDKADFQTYHLVIHPKQPIVIKKLALVFDQPYIQGEDTRIFCNGFQSNSESREFRVNEKIPQVNFFTKNKQFLGDDHIKEIPRAKNNFHSWTYTYVKNNNDFTLLGSLKENAAFTYFVHDTSTHQLTAEKDCAGLELTHSFPILDIFIGKGKEQKVFDNWFSAMEVPSLANESYTGWSSWNFYKNEISEEVISKNLDAFSKKEIDLDFFQIDNGYSTHVGDWLNIKSSFPNGLATISQKIKQYNYKSGIWLAPFICSDKSEIFQHKKQWLIKDKSGQPFVAGNDKNLGGNFYVLDFYQKEVQEYLIRVIHTFSQKWGFDFIKFDYLYTVCILPFKNKTRGQVMHDALEFLKRQLGNKIFFTAGVPLGSAMGKVDFCSISGSIGDSWKKSFEQFLSYRENESAIQSLRSTIGRWHLNGRAFQNVPDVFTLSKEKNKLTPNQQYTLLIINALCGNTLFNSDFLDDFTPEQLSEFQWVFKLKNSRVKEVQNLTNDKYLIHFTNDEKSFVAACNLSNKKASPLVKKQPVELEPFETMIFKI